MESTPIATSDTLANEYPEAEDAFGWAFQAMKNGNWRNAAERWAVLRQVYPEHSAVWIQAAIAHRHLGELDKAQTLLEHACKAFSDNPNAWLQKAEVAIAGKQWQQALNDLQYLQREFPADIAGWVRIADVHAMMGNRGKAYKENAWAREHFEDRPWPWVQYAEFAMQEGNHELALERWADLRQRFPEHSAGYQRAAEAAVQLGDERLARKLKLAQEYGNAWLMSTEKGEQEEQHHVNPPQRRSWLSFCDLVWTKARLNLKSEANQNHLRYLWWVIDPLLYMSVFYIVFGMLMQRGGEGYIAYLLTGLVPFQWFAKTIQHTSSSIIQGKGLMHQVRISPLFFPLVGIVQNTGKQLLVFLMLSGFLVFYGLPPTLHWIALIPVVLLQLLLMVVVSCAVAMLAPFVRDVINLVPTGIQFMMFMSGIFYTIDYIPEQWRNIFFINPMANILYQYRQILVENQWPDWMAMGWVALGCLLVLGGIILLYRRLESVFPRVVIE